jgi:hypothetical protein
MNLAWDSGVIEGATCLLLVKFSGLKVVQLLRKKRTAIAGNNCLTITSFF